MSVASGLAVYFVISNLFGIAQYAMMGKVDWSNVFKFSLGSSTPPSKAVTKKNK